MKSAAGVGDDELLLESNTDRNVEAWSPDGRALIYNSGGRDLWTWSFDTRKAQPFFQGKLPAYNVNFSPDGNWVAYTSFESGRSEIYIRPFAGFSGSSRGQSLISNAGGLSRNGAAMAKSCSTRRHARSWLWTSETKTALLCTARLMFSSKRGFPETGVEAVGWSRGTATGFCWWNRLGISRPPESRWFSTGRRY